MSKQPLIFGEVLFDCFPGDKKVLGGAPFNVAWHLQGFGCDPLFISAVGSDELGDTVLQTVSQWFHSKQEIEQSSSYPTGVVEIEFNEETHSFDIRSNQAYDFITAPSLIDRVSNTSPALLYHGTLALRTDNSRKTLRSIRDTVEAPVFVDLNLRAPWWDRQGIEDAVSNADWLKLNEEELCVVSGKELNSFEALVGEAHALTNTYDVAAVIITRGADGAFVVQKDGTTLHADPVPVPKMVDTVGAGDAFSSVWLLGQLKGWSVETSLTRASFFASRVCGMSGATTKDRMQYSELLAKWEQADD